MMIIWRRPPARLWLLLQSIFRIFSHHILFQLVQELEAGTQLIFKSKYLETSNSAIFSHTLEIGIISNVVLHIIYQLNILVRAADPT